MGGKETDLRSQPLPMPRVVGEGRRHQGDHR